MRGIGGNGTVTYTYDLAGNRMSEVARRTVRRHILMISENRIARNDIDEEMYVD